MKLSRKILFILLISLGIAPAQAWKLPEFNYKTKASCIATLFVCLAYILYKAAPNAKAEAICRTLRKEIVEHYTVDDQQKRRNRLIAMAKQFEDQEDPNYLESKINIIFSRTSMDAKIQAYRRLVKRLEINVPMKGGFKFYTAMISSADHTKKCNYHKMSIVDFQNH